MTRTTVLKSPQGAEWLTYDDAWLEPALASIARDELDALRPFFEGPEARTETKVKAPRLVLAFGDEPTAFVDLGGARPWSPGLRAIRDRLVAEVGRPFNYLLANWYRNGDDWTGWHSDKIEFHEEGSVIALVSLGATRHLAFRPIGQPSQASAQQLEHRSLVLMAYDLQRAYEHSIPQSDEPAERFSLTFRHLKTGVSA